MISAFQRALKECDRWGVPVIRVDPKDPKASGYHSKYEAPTFNAWLDDEFCVLFWAEEGEAPLQAAALIHEMAHAVIWRETGLNPDQCEEDIHLLALEREACRRIRGDWKQWMHVFQVLGPELGSTQDWPASTTMERHRILAKSLKWLEGEGLMKDGKPTYRQKYSVIRGKGRRIMTQAVARRIERETQILENRAAGVKAA